MFVYPHTSKATKRHWAVDTPLGKASVTCMLSVTVISSGDQHFASPLWGEAAHLSISFHALSSAFIYFISAILLTNFKHLYLYHNSVRLLALVSLPQFCA